MNTRPAIAFLGAGRVARTLAQALAKAGWPVVAAASRSLASAQALAREVPGCVACDGMAQAAERAELAFLTVPDDDLAQVAQAIPWRSGQAVVHCGGATEVSVLAPAQQCGALVGGFHPLQLFADPAVALRHMQGCTVTIEAPPELEAVLRAVADAVGYRAITLPPGGRGLYHAGSCFAAGFLLSLLREACDLWNACGIGDEDALAALLPLAQGALATAQEKGLAGAQAGPFSRGDSGVVRKHLHEVAALGEEHLALYRAIAPQQLRLARERGRLDAATLAALAAALRERS